MDSKKKIIVALDTIDINEALKLTKLIGTEYFQLFLYI